MSELKLKLKLKYDLICLVCLKQITKLEDQIKIPYVTRPSYNIFTQIIHKGCLK